MKRALLGLSLFAALALAVPAAAPAAGIDWKSYEEGQKMSAAKDRMMFVYFYTDWCSFCRKLEKWAFSNAEVAAYANAHLVPVRINADKNKPLAGKFGVRAYPTCWFVTPQGEQAKVLPGAHDAKTMLNVMRYMASGDYETMGFDDFMAKGGTGSK